MLNSLFQVALYLPSLQGGSYGALEDFKAGIMDQDGELLKVCARECVGEIVCVCVREREREKARYRASEKEIFKSLSSSVSERGREVLLQRKRKRQRASGEGLRGAGGLQGRVVCLFVCVRESE